VVDDQVQRAGDLIARMRALADQEPRVADCFDAAKPVAAAIRLVAPRHAADGIALSLRGTGLRLGVRGSAARLEQALLQLLSNARDAVLERRRVEPLAPARIEVVLRRSPTLVMIEVRDSGRGVPDALADRIFDPFFTTKEPGRGTGLGLAFVAAVARGLGGGIESWNLPGGGACFRMELAAVEPGLATRDSRRAHRAGAHAA
jgi:C4-dicarboxylate-specific signal transduction histidine kinase